MRPIRIIAGFGWATAACAAAVPVYRDHQALLPVFVRTGAGPEERAAADELARVLGRMSGIEWAVRSADDKAERGIHLGAGPGGPGSAPTLRPAADPLAPRAGEVGPDAFRIRTAGGSVYIEGATPRGLLYAVDWLLQNEAGVRWYSPGPLGEVIPRPGEWTLPEINLVKEPAFLSREFSGFESPAGAEWARRNGLHGTLEFGHALSHVFPPGLYADHPEWFPQLYGQRYRPSSVDDRDWQPNLAIPEAASWAANAALAGLASAPGRMSYSLGINDTVRFDQGPETRRLVEPIRYVGGMPDYSPLVFTFMNRAADAVARVAPNAYLGCLAYFWCMNPPPFPIRRNVIPYVCADRTQYFDKVFRERDLDLMSRWEASGARAFGLWEYAFGSGFVIPREPVAALADAVREGWKRGARGYFAEIGSSSGLDTFKAWALARMLWNPGLSLSDLEDDFFPGYYGPAGAPMRRFHEACQARWMGQEGGPFWLKYYGQDDQALLFPDKTCASLRAILSEADRLVSGDPVFSARVGRASRAFAVAEAYVAFDSERRVLAAACPNRSDPFPGGEGALEEAIGRLARARARFEAAYRDAAPDGDSQRPEPSVSDSLERDDPVPRLLFGAGCRDSSAPRRLLNGAGVEAATRPPWREMASSFAVGLPAAPNLTANSSFLEKDTRGEWPHFLYPRYGALPAKWTLRAMATEEGRVAIVDNESSGADLQRRSVRIEGAWDTQLYQWLPAKPGLAYLATARLRGRTSPGGDASLFLTFLSGTGGVLSGWMQSLPKGDTTGWRTQALCDRAPDRTGWVGIGIGCSRQTAGDWMEADCVEIRSETSATLP